MYHSQGVYCGSGGSTEHFKQRGLKVIYIFSNLIAFVAVLYIERYILNPFKINLMKKCKILLPGIITFLLTAQANAQNINTIAGNGTIGFSGDGGPATNAQLYVPQGLTVDASGNIYIVDNSNSRVRKITLSGIITTIAGNGTSGYAGDGGPATAAALETPYGIAVDGVGNIYISENTRIRKINTAGVISTFAWIDALGLATTSDGSLYAANSGNTIEKISPAGVVTTIAGNGTYGFGGDGGPATAAMLNGPSDVKIDGSGNIYIADQGNFRIRKINSSGIIQTIAGNGGYTPAGDGGPATAAQFIEPWSVALGPGNTLYILDALAGEIRKVSATGIISTIAGNGTFGYGGDGGPATAAIFDQPAYLCLDNSGNLLVSDGVNERVRKINTASLQTNNCSHLSEAVATSPNPACSVVSFINKGPGAKKLTVDILNCSGQLMGSFPVEDHLNLSLTNYPAGTYFCRFTTDDETTVKILEVQR
jgi:hypothetical protein